MAISKTDFVRGLQCPKMMWLDKHKPQEKIIPPEVQERLDSGNRFGDEAMGMFGEFVETTCFKEDGRLDYGKMISDTKQYLVDGIPVICEAAFSYYGNYCAADILRKCPDGYELYEVKNSDGVKDVFLQDVAFQKYILMKCGVKICRCFVVTASGDERSPYILNDVTAQIRPLVSLAYKKVWELSKIKNAKEEVCVPVGEQCVKPYECWYYAYCHTKKELP